MAINEDFLDIGQLLKKLEDKSYVRYIPLILHICATIDSVQGCTINDKVLALVTQPVKAVDLIVALTRTTNSDNLLVANPVFDSKYEQITDEIKTMLQLINKLQQKIGWL